MPNILATATNVKHLMEALFRKRVRQHKLAAYLRSDRRPWRIGYQEYRDAYLKKVLNDNHLLEKFRKSKPVNDEYGFRLDARVVEIPWALSHLAESEGGLLDAGSSFNREYILKAHALSDKNITILTLAPEAECHWKYGVSYVFGDLCQLDFRDACFNVIACISTIEHVGMDNTMYTGSSDTAQPDGTKQFLLAVKELKRVLKPGGVLYITFPYGQYENHRWFQQFDSRLMDTLISEFAPTHHRETIFRYDPDGWKLSDRNSCANCKFFDVHTSKYFNPRSDIEFPSDYPAGERAVACLELYK